MGMWRLVVFLFALAFCTTDGQESTKQFSIGGTRQNPAEIQALAESVRPEIKRKAESVGQAITKYEILKYGTQVVAGINYFLKIRVGDHWNSYIHARVNQNLTGCYSLDGLEYYHTKCDPLNYVQTFQEQET